MNLDRVGEFFQSDLIEMLSWIVWVGRYRRERNALQIPVDPGFVLSVVRG